MGKPLDLLQVAPRHDHDLRWSEPDNKTGVAGWGDRKADYAANQTTVTDPAAKVRRTLMDALGRLTQVAEGPNGLNYVTSYKYL